ncbi:MAG: deoxyuridine 5'-triphosphate nucleotidohydrolase [Sedimentibacter sp.]
MRTIAKFEKVSIDQFKKDWIDTFGQSDNIEEIYNSIKLPKRATVGSAGYDFYSPLNFKLEPKETIKIPTGIRAGIDESWVLMCFPRSGLGFKFRLQLNNTVGIIDSDYYFSDNEGHILIKLTNDSNECKTVNINEGDGIVQGIFIQYGLTEEDDVKSIRNGGFGSTTTR